MTAKKEPSVATETSLIGEDYWTRYYRENKEKILAKKRERYQNDPQYREGIKERARARWRDELRKGGREKGLKKDKRYLRPKIVQIDGKDVVVHSIGEFADRIGYTIATLKNWETLGVLPRATAVDDNGRRWYSEKFMVWFDSTIECFRGEEWELDTFMDKVLSEHKEALKSGAVERPAK